MDKGLISYQRTQTEGLSQRDLIVMCYRGAISYLNQAKIKHGQQDFDGFSEHLEKAHRVIFHLYTTLDMKRGGEIAERLADIYAFLISQIYLLNATKEVVVVDKLIEIMETLREGWAGLDAGAAEAGSAGRQQLNPQQTILSVEI